MLRTLAPGAHASKHGPVELHGYASSFGPVAATVSADASRAGLSPQQLARLAFPPRRRRARLCVSRARRLARSSARDDSPAETPSARRTIAGGSPAASCVAAIHWRPRTTSETACPAPQSSTRTRPPRRPGRPRPFGRRRARRRASRGRRSRSGSRGLKSRERGRPKPARTRGPSGFASDSRCVARTPVSTTYTRTPSPAAREGATPSRGSARWSETVEVPRRTRGWAFARREAAKERRAFAENADPGVGFDEVHQVRGAEAPPRVRELVSGEGGGEPGDERAAVHLATRAPGATQARPLARCRVGRRGRPEGRVERLAQRRRRVPVADALPKEHDERTTRLRVRDERERAGHQRERRRRRHRRATTSKHVAARRPAVSADARARAHAPSMDRRASRRRLARRDENTWAGRTPPGTTLMGI